jgi:hypothetical protein
MRSRSPSFVVTLAAGASLALLFGCRGRTDTDGLGSEAAALVADHDESEEVESEVEAGLEEPLSGAAASGVVDVASLAEAAAERARTGAAAFFQPAGCLVSTRAGNVVTHVFTGCTGPAGLVNFTGTVVATWSRTAAGVQVVHRATGFALNGARVDHEATLAYAVVNGVYTRTRTASSTGTTATGRPIVHQAEYTTTYDATTRCIRRDGASQTTIGALAFSRGVTGYERCGVGLGGCPTRGTITLVRPRLELVLSFPGGAAVDMTVNGRYFRRSLACNASAQ